MAVTKYFPWKVLRVPLFVSLFLAAASPVTTISAEQLIKVNGQSPGRIFEGIGGESAGASTRLLVDYPKKQRNEILNYLFKPDFGAALQNLKCELGGDMNSTDGTEPAYFRSRREYEHPKARYFARGYETWLMRQARKRNPNIRLGLLQWGAPGWLGDRHHPATAYTARFYSQDNANYIARVVQDLNQFDHIRINYVGCANERMWNVPWVLKLRHALNAAGQRHVHIEMADFFHWNTLVHQIKINPAFARAISAIGRHYPGYKSTVQARALHIPLWSGEDWSGAKPYTATMAKLINRNYIEGRMVRTIIWALETSYYNNLPAADDGPLLANEPWCGHYQVLGPIWAIAHTTQFAYPGWQYLNSACELLKSHGSVVALKSPRGHNFSIIIETEDATAPQQINIHISGGLPTGVPLHVWRSLPHDYFHKQADLIPDNGVASMTLLPHAIYSITTTTGQHKGFAADIPAAQAFPLPYKTSLSHADIAGDPKYFSDQEGAFNIVRTSGTDGHVLEQMITERQIPWSYQHKPFTIAGASDWHNYAVACDIRVPTGGTAGIIDRVADVNWHFDQSNGYRFMISHNGDWQLLRAAHKILAHGHVAISGTAWHRLKLTCQGYTIAAYLDGKKLSQVRSETYANGMAGLATGWNHAWFKNFTVTPLHHAIEHNLALNKPAIASSQWSKQYAPKFADDGHFHTRWNSADGSSAGQWLAINLERVMRVGRVVIQQFGGRIEQFKIQYRHDHQWLTAFSGNMKGKNIMAVHFHRVRTHRIRLLILATTNHVSPSVREFAVYR